MNFFNIVTSGYIIVAALLIFFVARDRRHPDTWCGQYRRTTLVVIFLLAIGAMASLDARFVEPYLLTAKTIDFVIPSLKQPLRVALITDIQSSRFKDARWTNKIVKKISALKPNLIIIGGDLIDNEGGGDVEVGYLEPLQKLARQFPLYYVLGNHEYGIGSETRDCAICQTGDRSALVIQKMEQLGAKLLRNQLACPEINHEKICLFGIDDIWQTQPNFYELKNWNQNLPLLYITHNPDGAMSWPKEIKKPDLVLSGHTHGGQVRLPFFGPIGNAGIVLPKQFYQGLNYWNNIPIFTSAGAGESGGPIRFFDPPEINIINLRP